MGVDRMEPVLSSSKYIWSIETAVGGADQSDINDDKGFGMVEIVISMFLIAVLAVSFLPVLIGALRSSALNVTVATSTQMINEQMDAARGEVSNCHELAAFVAESPPPVVDSQQVELTSARSAGACNDSTLKFAVLTISVTRTDRGTVVATATSLLTVQAAAPEPAPEPEASP